MNKTIWIEIPTEQGYNQKMLFNEEEFREFIDLVENQGRKEIGVWILEVVDDKVILYKSASFNKSTWSGPNYIMSRDDAKVAINNLLKGDENE